MKALGFTTVATTAAPRIPSPATLDDGGAASDEEALVTATTSAPETEDATEVRREAFEDPATDAGAVIAVAASRSKEELLLRVPIEAIGAPEGSDGNLTWSKSAGLAAFRMKPESESTIHF